ncbi:major facilitator superfamily domain-containing protein 6-like [Rhopilema esculentum]|uniref:major facilitator superfamily domain-containing protein 6-like n=1 Tax=Rhopilema esculentum TaxID=499914 RepID=UPI0031DB29BF|eukprot:gene14668-5758_t
MDPEDEDLEHRESCVQVAKDCCCGMPSRINRKLLVSKGFYFFFWSAYGSFFPLLGVYFKQIGMNPSQSGLLVGCRPLIEFISAPSMGSLADRLNVRKVMLLFNIVCWMSFVFPFAFIKPSDNTCHRYMLLAKNLTEIVTKETSEVQQLLKSNNPDVPKIIPHRKGTVVFSEESIHNVFWLLLFLSLVGEFFACPATTLADTATLNYLGENKEKYGRQRMFGSLGWGSAMLVVGLVIDSMPSYVVCGVTISKDYTYCFYFFLGYMIIALAVSTRFTFKNEHEDDIIRGTPKDVIKLFLDWRYMVVIFVAFYAGLGMGLARVFLFWHLEDLGAPPTLFGLSSALDHVAETVTYFFTETIIHYIGHVEVICFGLLANFFRFIAISMLVNPWLILPLDILQGFAHAGVWAALTSYMGRAAPPGYRAAVQGILQGFYYGLGRAVGAIVGGVLSHSLGTDKTFRYYGYGNMPILILLFVVVKFSLRKQKQTEEQSKEETENSCEGGEIPVFKKATSEQLSLDVGEQYHRSVKGSLSKNSLPSY